MTSTRPYLIRALYDWIIDNRCTPHLLVDAEREDVVVPQHAVQNGKIVLNISPSAVHALDLGDAAVAFGARFNSTPMDVFIPTSAVLGIYARENGQGMLFEQEEGGTPPSPASAPASESKPKRPQLKVVK